jgi:hypothetical protein
VSHLDQTGWICPSCKSITCENETKADKLLERLIAMERDKIKVNVCQFCETAGEGLYYCSGCRMLICNSCKAIHRKTPATKKPSC